MAATPTPRERRRGLLVEGTLAALVAWGCAHVEAPSGGPLDQTPPFVVDTWPDSAATGVPLADTLTLTFSERMDRRSVERGFRLSPAVDLKSQRWRGATWTLGLAEPLLPHTTYVCLLPGSTQDRRKNHLGRSWTFGFSTGDTLDDGILRGTVIGKRYPAKGAAVLAWAGELAPLDTTREGYPPDPLRVGIADEKGTFELTYLPRNRPLHIAAFFDADGNRRHDPEVDFWGFLEEVMVLSDTTTALGGVELYLAARDEAGTVAGDLADSTCASLDPLRLLARVRASRDSLRALLEGERREGQAPNLATLTREAKGLADPAERKDAPMTASDSLAIGARLLELDTRARQAAADSAYCATPTIVELLGENGEPIRSARGSKFSWSDVPAGIYRLRAFRDLDADSQADSTEPRADAPHALEVRPLRVLERLHLTLKGVD